MVVVSVMEEGKDEDKEENQAAKTNNWDENSRKKISSKRY